MYFAEHGIRCIFLYKCALYMQRCNVGVCLVDRGSAIAKIVGSNVTKFDEFENEVRMYVYEEMVDGKKLTEIINTTHENVKYLPGKKLPENVVSVASWFLAGPGRCEVCGVVKACCVLRLRGREQEHDRQAGGNVDLGIEAVDDL